MFPNFWQGECSGGARRRAWKRSGLRRTLNETVSKVDNLVWLPSPRKRENWSRGPTVDDFCAGTHGCPPKIGDPRLTHRGPRVDLRPLVCFITAGPIVYYKPVRVGGGGHVAEVINHFIEVIMSTCAVSSKRKDAEHRPRMVWVID